MKKASAMEGLKTDFGGSWKRTGPNFSAKDFASVRKIFNCSGVHASLASWVMFFGALTEKRKLSDVEAAHFSQVEMRWER